jgi:HEAT repeat protein
VRWVAAALLATALAGCRAGSRGDLESPDPSRRAEAIVELGRSHAPDDLAALVVAQQDPDPRVRRAAAGAYGARGGERSMEGLAALLGDPDPDVVAVAARALGAIRPDGPGTDARTVAELHRRAGLALAAAYGRANARGRAEIASAMQQIGVSLREGVEAEARLLWDQNTRGLREASPAGRAGAAEELGRSGRAEAVKVLLPLLEEPGSDPGVIAATARGLGWSGVTVAMDAIESGLKSRWAEVAEASAWALGNIGDPAAAEALADLGASAPGRLAHAAVAALDALPTAPEVGMALCEVAVRSTDPSVAERAARRAHAREADCPERPVAQRISRGGPDALAALAAFGALGLPADRVRGPGEKALTLFQSSTDSRARTAAARAMGNAPYPSAVPSLLRRAVAIQERAARASRSPGTPAPTAEASDSTELGEIAVALARLAPESSRGLADRLASDSDPRLRAAGATAMGVARRPDVLGRLATLATDEDASVRRASFAALASLGPAGLPALAGALHARPGDGEDLAALAQALGATGDPAALPLLGSLLAGGQAGTAATSIGRLGSPGGVPLLLAALGTGQVPGRLEMIDALALLGSADAGESLARDLTSDRPDVRAAAARALGRLRYEPAAIRLEALRADYYAAVRRSAVEALARLPATGPRVR